jgi:hypothetical protein
VNPDRQRAGGEPQPLLALQTNGWHGAAPILRRLIVFKR